MNPVSKYAQRTIKGCLDTGDYDEAIELKELKALKILGDALDKNLIVLNGFGDAFGCGCEPISEEQAKDYDKHSIKDGRLLCAGCIGDGIEGDNKEALREAAKVLGVKQ